jgi:hypothetical protein
MVLLTLEEIAALLAILVHEEFMSFPSFINKTKSCLNSSNATVAGIGPFHEAQKPPINGPA